MFRHDNKSFERLKKHSLDLGIEETHFENIYEECREIVKNERRNKKRSKFQFFTNVASVLTLGFILYSITMEKPYYYNLLLSNSQQFVYPVMRFWRLITLPFHEMLPHITEYYDETCLIENPYFYVSDLKCEPCSSLKSVELLEDENFRPETSPPFLYKTEVTNFDYEDLKKVYMENQAEFDKNAAKFLENGKKRILLRDFFDSENIFNGTDKYFMWRLNRIIPVALIRKLFPRPRIIPQSGQSIERFIIFNQRNAPEYKIPDTECYYVFIMQFKGERIIELEPTKECRKDCNKISVKLTENYMLWYNWWIWKPKSLPSPSNESSISFISSYCVNH